MCKCLMYVVSEIHFTLQVLYVYTITVQMLYYRVIVYYYYAMLKYPETNGKYEKKCKLQQFVPL